MPIYNKTTVLALKIQELIRKGYTFKEVPNTSNVIEIIDSEQKFNLLSNSDFKKWIFEQTSDENL